MAKAVSGYVKDSEGALHEGLEEMYERVGDVTLRWVARRKMARCLKRAVWSIRVR